MKKLLLPLTMCMFFLAGCNTLCGSDEPVYEPVGKTGEHVDHDYK